MSTQYNEEAIDKIRHSDRFKAWIKYELWYRDEMTFNEFYSTRWREICQRS